jgi:hypothetical protein
MRTFFGRLYSTLYWYLWRPLLNEVGMAGPVSLTWSSSVAAGAIFLPLDGWQFEFAPFGGAIEVITDATAVGMVCTLTNAGNTIVEESPIKAGGTAGVIPSALNTAVYVGGIAKGDRLKIKVRNTTGAAVTSNGICTLVPGRGR